MSIVFGWVPRPEETARFIAALPVRHIPDRLIMQATQRDVLLWKAKDQVQPTWTRKAQGIGDCVSWGMELAATCLMWMQSAAGEIAFEAEAATEAIYGGCRVEVNGGRSPLGNEDGAAGSWAADWVEKYGVLLRKNYADQTGNPAHDLTTYSPKRAKEWGYYGCGGKDDKSALDDIARRFPIKGVTQARSVQEAAAAVDHGCPFTIASDVGFEGRTGQCVRDNEGIVRRGGQWPHQMCVLGIKYLRGEPLFRIFNSWAKSVSGPDPDINDDAVSACSWWCVAEDMERILRQQDSFAYSKVSGFDLQPYNFSTDLLV